jgi:5-(carboxyamino)imidazole ribonucleotide synthase
MWVHAAQSLGYRCMVLDPDPQSPAGAAADRHLQAPYLDSQALQTLGQACAAVSTEFENVPAQALQALAQWTRVAPGANAVCVAQDRVLEKAHFQACGVAVAPHHVIQSRQDLAHVPTDLFPGILKTTRMGYDGKGQVRVNHASELAAAFESLQSATDTSTPCILEHKLDLQFECSVVLARASDGSHSHLPVQLNLHRNGILALTEVAPGLLNSTLEDELIEATRTIAQGLDYVGVLCVEYFIVALPDGSCTWVVNEMAPRPHNSGHHSIDACDLSQFEMQVRCMAGLPLRPVRLHSPAAMINLLGDAWWRDGQLQEPDWPALLAVPGTRLHLYGKTQARPGRKMGHVNITASDVVQLRERRDRVAHALGLPAFHTEHQTS